MHPPVMTLSPRALPSGSQQQHVPQATPPALFTASGSGWEQRSGWPPTTRHAAGPSEAHVWPPYYEQAANQTIIEALQLILREPMEGVRGRRASLELLRDRLNEAAGRELARLLALPPLPLPEPVIGGRTGSPP